MPIADKIKEMEEAWAEYRGLFRRAIEYGKSLEAELAAADEELAMRDKQAQERTAMIDGLEADNERLRELLETADIYINPDYEDQLKLKIEIRAVLDR